MLSRLQTINKLQAFLNNLSPAKSDELKELIPFSLVTGFTPFDPAIDTGYDIVNDQVVEKDIKISGLWSNIFEKKQRAEVAFEKYSELFQQFNMGEKTEEVNHFVDMMKSYTPKGTDVLKLFKLLQNLSEWKEGKEILNEGKVTTTVSLEPVQDEETIDLIKGIIVSLDTPMSSVTLTGVHAFNIDDLGQD